MSQKTSRYDISQLLNAVASTSSSLSAPSDFDELKTPTVRALVSGELTLVVAYSQSCCFLQEFHGDMPGTLIEVCRFEPRVSEQKEEITCTTFVSMRDEKFLIDDDTISFPIEIERSDEFKTLGPPTPHKSLLKGTIVGKPQCFSRVAVVIGTTSSRLYSVELRVDLLEWRIVMDDIPIIICEVLPADPPQAVNYLKSLGKTPFQPSGGVISLSHFDNKQQETFVWVVYGDGCMIRIRSAALFPSIWQKGSLTHQSVDEVLGKPALLRCQVQLPSPGDAENRGIVPFYQSVPSLGHLLFRPRPGKECQLVEAREESSPGLALSEYEDEDSDVIQAIVFSSHSSAPALTFFTSERHFEYDFKDVPSPAMLAAETDLVGALFDGTKALVGGVLGATIGVFRFGGRSTKEDGKVFSPDALDPYDSMDISMDLETPVSPFPSLWSEPVRLFAAEEYHDAPRKLDYCTVAPNGLIAAAIDNLGRILLLDLTDKHLLRVFKGYRDASIYWIHSDRPGATPCSMPSLNLVISSKHRKSIEVFQVQQGSIIKLAPADRTTQIIPYQVSGPISPCLTRAFLLRSSIPGSMENFLEHLQIQPLSPEEGEKFTPKQPQTHERTDLSRRSVGFQLQYLRQLLSADAVQFTCIEILEALRAISSLADLSIALDLLSKSTLLEEKLIIQDSAFHKEVVRHCQEMLRSAVQPNQATAMSPAGRDLSFNIQYHVQLIEAYDLLEKCVLTSEKLEDVRSFTDPNSWTTEAVGWMSTSEKVTGPDVSFFETSLTEKVRFSAFASACTMPSDQRAKDGKLSIYFSDSSKTRRAILLHIFKPLLSDAFASNVVLSVFEALGIREEISYIENCFGEWALSLPFWALRSSGLSSERSTLGRFLKDLGSQQLGRSDLQQGVVLENLFRLCRTSDDLTRSFVLGTLCRNALEIVSSRKERLTYGKILSSDVVGQWDNLLRKLRLSMVISFKLKNRRLIAPVTVSNLEEDGLFSMYELVAMDLLSVTRRNDEIISLEATLSASSLPFDAASEAGDDPQKISQLQASCIASSGESPEYNDLPASSSADAVAPLLFFLPKFNKPSLLGAHRVRLLAQFWHREPRDFILLQEAIATIRHLSKTLDMPRLALAVAMDLWRSIIAPIYRAHLCGFQEVHEVDETIFRPVVSRKDWILSLGDFSIQFLHLLKEIPWSDEAWEAVESILAIDSDAWPNGRTDHILMSLMGRSERVNAAASDRVLSAICCLNLFDDIGRVMECIPDVLKCFEPLSLVRAPEESSDDIKVKQIEFLEDAVIKSTLSYEGPALDSFSLGVIELLGQVWEVDPWVINTLFLQCMYEQGKDHLVDELATKGTGSYDVGTFIDAGVDIVCMRLHTFLCSDEMQASDMRGTISMLDADLCEWIQQRAKATHHRTRDPVWDVSISETHRLALRLLGLSTSSRVNATLRVKIHALTVSSGVLVNAQASKASATLTR